jgi:hypothetical protein
MNNLSSTNSLFSAGSWLLLLGSMAALASAGYQVYARNLVEKPPQQFHFNAPHASAPAEQMDLSKIVQAHVFGVVPIKVKEKPKVVEAPKTQLKLTLTGVITAIPEEQGRAMIEVQRGTTSIVRVGEEIGKTGARLNSVFTDHILIDRQGKLEKLLIDRATLEINNLAAQNSQTISALNINVSEFEALAKVDPADLEIERLLPKQPQVAQDSEPANAVGADGQSIEETGSQSATQLKKIQADLEMLQSIEEMERQHEEEQRLRELEAQQAAADPAKGQQ